MQRPHLLKSTASLPGADIIILANIIIVNITAIINTLCMQPPFVKYSESVWSWYRPLDGGGCIQGTLLITQPLIIVVLVIINVIIKAKIQTKRVPLGVFSTSHFGPPALSSDVKNSHILPTGQWYAPLAVINDALIMHYLALSCIILHYLALSCTVLQFLQWCPVVPIRYTYSQQMSPLIAFI